MAISSSSRKLLAIWLVAGFIAALSIFMSQANPHTASAEQPLNEMVFLPSIIKSHPDYLFIEHSVLVKLPTNTPAWQALKAAADSDPGTPDLCNQDNRVHPKVTFASALVAARTGEQAYIDRARYLILSAYPTQVDGCENAVLSLSRQLAAYVMAADLIRMKDDGFNNWLYVVRSKNIGGNGRWYVLRNTAYDSASNWGIFALASIIAADRFLNDLPALKMDWQVFSAYGVPYAWPFSKTIYYNETWSCIPANGTGQLPVAINPPCTKNGYDLDGAPVEDSSRTEFPVTYNYPTESAQGLVVQALLLARAGYPAWTVNDSQIRRMEEFRGRFNNVNYSSTDYHVTWITNKIYGLNQPTKPASYGRIFGFTDWLFAP